MKKFLFEKHLSRWSAVGISTCAILGTTSEFIWAGFAIIFFVGVEVIAININPTDKKD